MNGCLYPSKLRLKLFVLARKTFAKIEVKALNAELKKQPEFVMSRIYSGCR